MTWSGVLTAYNPSLTVLFLINWISSFFWIHKNLDIYFFLLINWQFLHLCSSSFFIIFIDFYLYLFDSIRLAFRTRFFWLLFIFGTDNLTVLPYLLTTAHNSTLAYFQAENIQKKRNRIWQLNTILTKMRFKRVNSDPICSKLPNFKAKNVLNHEVLHKKIKNIK